MGARDAPGLPGGSSEAAATLAQVPRRFWTPGLARLALDQGRPDLAAEVIAAVRRLAKGSTALDAELAQLEDLATAAREAEDRERLRAGVLARLEGCLKRARSLRREGRTHGERADR